MTELDKFDQQIISILSNNAKTAAREIAEEIGLSRTAVTTRIKRLENSGIITGYTINKKSGLTDDQDEQNGIFAFVHLKFDLPHCEKITKALLAINDVKSVHSIAGNEIDFILTIKTTSTQRLYQIGSKIEEFPNLTTISTHISMDEKFSR